MEHRPYLLAILALLLTCVTGVAAQKNSPRVHSVRHSTYTSPDGAFTFMYSGNPKLPEPGQYDSAESDCYDDSIICLTYPKSTRDGTNYGTATFKVREVKREDYRMSAEECVTPHSSAPSEPDYYIDPKRPTKTIGGILFIHGYQLIGAGPQTFQIDYFRTFHEERCFELTIGDSGTDTGFDSSFDANGQQLPMTHRQLNELQQPWQALQSFRFLK